MKKILTIAAICLLGACTSNESAKDTTKDTTSVVTKDTSNVVKTVTVKTDTLKK